MSRVNHCFTNKYSGFSWLPVFTCNPIRTSADRQRVARLRIYCASTIISCITRGKAASSSTVAHCTRDNGVVPNTRLTGVCTIMNCKTRPRAYCAPHYLIVQMVHAENRFFRIAHPDSMKKLRNRKHCDREGPALGKNVLCAEIYAGKGGQRKRGSPIRRLMAAEQKSKQCRECL